MQVQLYTLTLRETKAYLLALAFVAGNIILPQVCHFIPQGGLIFLPIYFFTLIGAYKYGWQVGLCTAVASPIINSWLFGMPPQAMVPIILIKSILLAVTAGLTAHYTKRLSILSILGVVLTYQVLGGIAEWAMTGSLQAALQDFQLGLPGIILQIVGGYLVIKYLLKN